MIYRGAVRSGTALALALSWSGAATGQTLAPAEDEIVVTGRVQQLYRVEETTTGKLATEPLAAAQSIQVISRDLIEDQGARDAQDLYRNISGVSFFSHAGVTARGFRQEEIFFDGLRGDPYVAFAVPQLFNVERLEFLKGPAGMLYGPGAPGGLFNYITKQPSEAFSARVSAVIGTEGRAGGAVEIEGALPGLGGQASRFGAFYEDRNQPRTNAASEVRILDAGVRVPVGAAALTLQATHYEQELQANRLRGVPTDNLGHFLADRRWNHNERSDFLNLVANVAQARLDWDIADSVAFDATVRYSESDERQNYHEPRGLADTDGDGVFDLSSREFRDQIRQLDQVSFGANAVWSADFGAIANRVLVGVDAYESELRNNNRPSLAGGFVAQAGRPPPISLIDPIYGLAKPATYTLGPRTLVLSRQKRQGAYALEEATLGPVIATLGVRADRFEDTAGAVVFEDENATWRAGLVYRLRRDVSLYAQWAESYEPQAVSQQNPLGGGPFAPTEGEIVEAGLKTELFGGKLQSTLAVYEIVRTNILQSDPRGDVGGDGVNDLVAFGEVTSTGAELDLAADVTDNWVLTGGLRP
jgi:iron complex outermembrane receptor protein